MHKAGSANITSIIGAGGWDQTLTSFIIIYLSQTDADNDLIGDPCDTNKDRYYMTSSIILLTDL